MTGAAAGGGDGVAADLEERPEAAFSVILRCAGVTLALPLAAVVEVVLVVAPAAPLPRAPRYCLGAIDYHGQLVPLLDLAARLGLAPLRSVVTLADGRIMLLRGRAGLIGCLVDAVLELSEAPLEALSVSAPALAGLGGLLRGIVRYREGEAAPLLDPAALLPVVAGERLRRGLAEVAAGPRGERRP